MKLGDSKRSILIRRFLLSTIKANSPHLIQDAMETFQVTRQTVHNHLVALVKKDYLIAEGNTRGRVYRLGSNRSHAKTFPLKGLKESDVYCYDFNIVFSGLPDELEDICHYGFTEMLNNAIDHSCGKFVNVSVDRTSKDITIKIADDGEGIFDHIARIMKLRDRRESILELSKGKLTTDPENHSGQGIFFTSRVFDEFYIFSNDLVFSHNDHYSKDFLLHTKESHEGTTVLMKVALDTSKNLTAKFNEFSGNEEDDYAFNKTVVPLRLALFEGGRLISRSQAKRILHRVEKFKTVMLDFTDVYFIGQAFADEVFRVFARKNKQIQLIHMNATVEIEKTIIAAKNNSD